MPTQKNYYEILGVPQSATRAEIRDSYRQLAQIHHPDKGGDPRLMEELNLAHKTLSSNSDREIYDYMLRTGRANHQYAYNQHQQSQNSGPADTKTANKAETIRGSLELIDAARSVAVKLLVKGLCWFVGGLVVTGIAYSSAPEGGTYIVTWGAILYGVYEIVRGLYYLASPSSLIKKAAAEES